MTMETITPPRCCGDRKEGGVYCCTLLGDDGVPARTCLICEPQPLPAGLTLSAQGVLPFERDGTTHAINWVGQQYWKNTADYVEEFLRLGGSTRFPLDFPFEKLTSESRLLHVHARARIENSAEFGDWTCPHTLLATDWHRQRDEKAAAESAARAHHPGHDPVCLGACWHDIEGGEPLDEDEGAHPAAGPGGLVLRRLPGVSYSGRRRPDGVTPQYTPAIFLSCPIHRIDAIDGGGVERALEATAGSVLPVVVCES